MKVISKLLDLILIVNLLCISQYAITQTNSQPPPPSVTIGVEDYSVDFTPEETQALELFYFGKIKNVVDSEYVTTTFKQCKNPHCLNLSPHFIRIENTYTTTDTIPHRCQQLNWINLEKVKIEETDLIIKSPFDQ